MDLITGTKFVKNTKSENWEKLLNELNLKVCTMFCKQIRHVAENSASRTFQLKMLSFVSPSTGEKGSLRIVEIVLTELDNGRGG